MCAWRCRRIDTISHAAARTDNGDSKAGAGCADYYLNIASRSVGVHKGRREHAGQKVAPMRGLKFLFGALTALAAHAAHSRVPANELVKKAGWDWQVIPAGTFDLATARRLTTAPADTLTVYIEGDGLAYASPTERAMDPTPTDPVALRMALQHPGSGPVAWLARPCQFGPRARNCQSDYWTIARYSPEVVASASKALDRLIADTAGASHVILVGYSGGGALAALLAERRRDISALVTVAANLDVGAWIKMHDLTPLVGSLDPAFDAARLAGVGQVHFVGARDRVVDERIARSFAARLPGSTDASIIVVAGQDHGCCWTDLWPQLASRPELLRIKDWRQSGIAVVEH